MIVLNQRGCPSRIRIRILELRNGEPYLVDSYASIILVQRYLNLRTSGLTYKEHGLPVECRFYLFSADHPDYSGLSKSWVEGLTPKELEDYLND